MSGRRSSLLAAVLALAVVPLSAGTGVLVTVSNPSQVVRKSETVEVRLADLSAGDSLLGRAGIAVVDKATGERIVSQKMDAYLLFQSDFGARETKTFLVMPEEKPPGNVGSMVDGYFALPREDYAWENDRIAFRVYGPALAAEVNNGIDVWTKRVRTLIVRKWYAADESSGTGNYYHTDRGEGADFFAVGKSLGAGGSGIWYKGMLFQPGVFSSYRMLAHGPIRTSFELRYTGWNVGGKRFVETKRISLDAGWNLNRIEVQMTGVSPGDSLLVACGLVKRKNVSVHADDRGGLLALWGPTNDDPVNGSLGTGVLLAPSTVAGRAEDSSQVMLLGRISSGGAFSYWAGAGWTRSGDFHDSASWLAYLKEAFHRLLEPLQVSVHPSGK